MRDAMKKVVDNGGSLPDARKAYNDASVKRMQLIDITKNLNVKYGLAVNTFQ